MAKTPKMTEDELISAINAARDESQSQVDSELSTDRTEALDRYYGRAYGNEVEGRSAVVSKDLSDTVDWMMPSLIRVFMSTDEVVKFIPAGAEDEEQAQQETDYTNYVLMQENNGFLVFHDAFKDALLLRNGYFKAYWDEYEVPVFESYRNLTVPELAQVVDGDVEIVEKRESEGYDANGAPVQTYDVKLRRRETKGKCCVVAVPPEEIMVHRLCRGPLSEAMYIEHRPPMTRGDLIAMGLPKGWVMDRPVDDGSFGGEDSARDLLITQGNTSAYYRMAERVDYREVYIRIDYDNDGLQEIRRVVMVGDEIAPGPEWNTEVDAIPFASLTPNRMPHRHIGRSVADEVLDLMLIKTTLLRNILDNVYQSNNQRTVINGNVNLADMLVSRPGGLVRTSGIPAQDVMPLTATPILAQALPMVEYIDSVKEVRTGVGRATLGLDADTLQQSTKGAYIAAQNSATQKIEMVARMFAETGVRELFLLVHGLLVRNQDKEKVVRLRNQYVPVDPRTWRTRYDVVVNVGLGSGNQEQSVQNAMMIGQAQLQLAPMGLIEPEHAYATFELIAHAAGQKNAAKFAADPSSDEFKAKQSQKQPPIDPLVQSKQVETQGKVQIESAKIQSDQQAKQADVAIEAERLRLDRERLELEKQRFALEVAQAQAAANKPVEQPDPMEQEFKRREQGIREYELQSRVREVELKHGPANAKAAAEADAIRATAQANAQIAEAVGALAAQASDSQAQVAEALAAVAKGQQEVVKAVSAPKKIDLQRGANDKLTGATVKPGG